mmetsp:Transcript_8479/g.38584  ORF Transcript_8479/g.38584 Transcript_8479/m.38584 type:complete len:410 (+) Transcript_8479:215-1444(+)
MLRRLHLCTHVKVPVSLIFFASLALPFSAEITRLLAFKPKFQANELFLRARQIPSGCKILADYSEYCILRNACVDSRGLLLSENVFKPVDSISPLSNFPNSFTIEEPRLPARGWVNARANPVEWTHHVHRDFVNNSIFVTGFDDADGLNPFHFAESVLTFFSFSMHNKAVAADVNKVVLYRERPSPNSWLAGFTNLVFGNSTVFFQSDMSETFCAERVVVGGTIISLFEGPHYAEIFRQSAYGYFGIQPTTRNKDLRITYLLRKDRTALNTEGIFNCLQKHHLPYAVIDIETLSFREHVELLANTNLLISPHGAGLINAIFMQQEQAVIELFPSKVWYYELYLKISRSAGLFYTFVLGEQLDDTARTIRKCFSSECQFSMKKNFTVSLSDFEDALLLALSWLGHESILD